MLRHPGLLKWENSMLSFLLYMELENYYVEYYPLSGWWIVLLNAKETAWDWITPLPRLNTWLYLFKHSFVWNSPKRSLDNQFHFKYCSLISIFLWKSQWWHHVIEIYSTLLALFDGNVLVTSGLSVHSLFIRRGILLGICEILFWDGIQRDYLYFYRAQMLRGVLLCAWNTLNPQWWMTYNVSHDLHQVIVPTNSGLCVHWPLRNKLPWHCS